MATPTVFDVKDVVTPEIVRPIPSVGRRLSILSLVILFFRSLVVTSPTGDLIAKD